MKDLTGKCVKVENEKQAEILQLEAFKQGFSWGSGEVEIKNKHGRYFSFHSDRTFTFAVTKSLFAESYENINFVDLFIKDKPTLETAALILLEQEEKQRGLERSEYFKNLNVLNSQLQDQEEKNTTLKLYLMFCAAGIVFLTYCLIFGEHCK